MKYIQQYPSEFSDCLCGSGFENCDCAEHFDDGLDDCGICPMGECDCYDIFCCYDPRYQGEPGRCHCQEYQENIALQQTWTYKIKHFLFEKWLSIKNQYYLLKTRIKRLFYDNRVEEDSTESAEDLPF